MTPTPGNDTTTSLAGISLGDTLENVIGALGEKYNESTEIDISGFLGEDVTVLTYNNGVTIALGKTSGKVLRIASSNPAYQTDLGIKVGDTAKTVFDTYRPKYKEAVSRQTNKTLEGWFHMEDGSILIFDFDKSDGSMVNDDIKPDSKVEEIVLSYWKFFD